MTPASQTLSRGIRVLEILAESAEPLSITELTERMGVHRSIAYRLLRTLEDHGLVARDGAGHLVLGTGLAALASAVARDLREAALPELTAVADELGMTCFVAVLLDAEEAVTLVSATPRRTTAVVSYRAGHRHPLTRGAPGKAILLTMPRASWPPVEEPLGEELDLARTRGWATSRGEVTASLRSVAVPLSLPGEPPAAVAVVHVELTAPPERIAERLTAAATAIARAHGS